jgi:hypothetical protein
MTIMHISPQPNIMPTRRRDIMSPLKRKFGAPILAGGSAEIAYKSATAPMPMAENDTIALLSF